MWIKKNYFNLNRPIFRCTKWVSRAYYTPTPKNLSFSTFSCVCLFCLIAHKNTFTSFVFLSIHTNTSLPDPSLSLTLSLLAVCFVLVLIERVDAVGCSPSPGRSGQEYGHRVGRGRHRIPEPIVVRVRRGVVFSRALRRNNVWSHSGPDVSRFGRARDSSEERHLHGEAPSRFPLILLSFLVQVHIFIQQSVVNWFGLKKV